MFKSLIIQNFQSHKDSYLEFSPNVTAIVGLNNHGKSAILKAIRKVVRDDPEGMTFIRDGEKECLITLGTDKGTVLRRIRNDKSDEANMYVVNNTPFAKFARTGIPLEAKDILSISDIQIFTDIEIDLNFQTQLDDMFLIQGDGLASKRGKVLGKTTGVDIVAKAIQLAAAEERSKTIKKNDLHNDLDRIDGELLGYEGIDSIATNLTDIESRLGETQNIQTRLDNLNIIFQSLVHSTTNAQVITDRLKILDINFSDRVDEIKKKQNLLRNLQIIRDLTEKISILLTNIKYLKLKLLNLSISANSIEQIDLPTLKELRESHNLIIQLTALERKVDIIIPSIREVQQLYTSWKKIDEINDARLLRSCNIESTKAGLKALLQQETETSEELNNLKQELGVCPVCQKPF